VTAIVAQLKRGTGFQSLCHKGIGQPSVEQSNANGLNKGELAIRGIKWQNQSMTATITIDDAGQINLPEALKRVFGVEPGVRLRAEVTSDRIEIVKDIPMVTAGVLENGVLVLPKLGIKMDAAAAIRAERDEQAERALPR
jgi:bifunctional DNA-binding transcriptional regulator/antitoxin component of YhaV-PrlF toxin-antitoxin module